MRTSLACARVLAASLALVLAIKSRALSNQQAKKAGGDTAGLGGVARAALKNTKDTSQNASLGLADTCKPRPGFLGA